MNKIVKTCQKHGELTLEQVKEEKTKNGYLTYRCHLCKIEKDRRWKDSHREQHIKASTRWKKNNRDHYNAWVREDRKKDPEKYRKYEAHRRKIRGALDVTNDILCFFKITRESYEELFTKQSNLCAICKKPETRKSRTEGNICRLSLDHCHYCEEKKGKGIHAVRGLLCSSCNTAIGKFEDNIDLLKSAIKYLEDHNHIA